MKDHTLFCPFLIEKGKNTLPSYWSDILFKLLTWPLLQNQWIPHSLQPPILPHLFHVHQHRARSPVRHQRSLPFQSSKVPWGLGLQLLTAPTVKRLNRFLTRPAVKVCLRVTSWWRSMGEWFAVVHTMMLLTYWRNVPEEKRHILSFRGEVSGFLSLNLSHGSSTISHFRVHFSLYFKASLHAKSLFWISVFIHIQNRSYYHNKNFALSLALKERLRVTQISLGGFSMQLCFFIILFFLPVHLLLQ